MKLKIIFERESDQRWIAEIPAIPGVMVYGVSREEALKKVQVLALQTIADLIEHGELVVSESLFFEYDQLVA